MAPFTKPFLPVDDQIALLKARGMTIADEAKAKLCLMRIGYYRLSAYWYPFRDILPGAPAPGSHAPVVRADTFMVGTSFEEVHEFYVFDKKLRLLAMDALERIEIAIRTDISNLLGACDPWAHRKGAFLDGKFVKDQGRTAGQTRHQDWLSGLDRKFTSSKEDFARHFRARYAPPDPPIWIASEVWDWGMLSHFFAGMKANDKDQIAATFGALNGRQLETWLRALNDVRNICAHHSRLWNRVLVVIPSLPKVGSMPDLDHIPRPDPSGNNQALSRLYTALVIMRILLMRLHPNHSKWHQRIADHAKSAPKNPIIAAAKAGFPTGWDTQSIWL